MVEQAGFLEHDSQRIAQVPGGPGGGGRSRVLGVELAGAGRPDQPRVRGPQRGQVHGGLVELGQGTRADQSSWRSAPAAPAATRAWAEPAVDCLLNAVDTYVGCAATMGVGCGVGRRSR